MKVTASALRNDIYNLLDEVLETGSPLRITRKGGELEIVPVKRSGKLIDLPRHDCMPEGPESVVHLDWSEEWNSDLP